MLHAGWPGGMVIGGVLLMLMGGFHWKWRIGLYLLPTLLYGYLMLGQKFPVQERVASGVSYADMLREFGWASCFIVSFFVVFAFDTVFGSLVLRQYRRSSSRSSTKASAARCSYFSCWS
jgi:hypothetical protein